MIDDEDGVCGDHDYYDDGHIYDDGDDGDNEFADGSKTKMAMGGILMEILVTIVKQNVENQVPQIQVWESARVCCRMLITNNTPMFDLR